MMHKIITVVGARPQFIKSAAISRAINNTFSNQLEEIIIHTGQHYDEKMSNVFFNELNIPKEKYNLKIGSSNHAVQTAKMMIALDEIYEAEKPDAILLYGDTNSTLAASLVAIKRHIPIIHIEGGVRSFNKKFPEEVNRLICDHVSSIIFVPSDNGLQKLQREGLYDFTTKKADDSIINNPKIFRCGDIMYDNTLYFKDKANEYFKNLCERLHLPTKNYFLVTSHRPSNVDSISTLHDIFRFFEYCVDTLNKKIIFPVHPRTNKLIMDSDEINSIAKKNGIYCIEPVSFIEMIGLEKNSDIIITDSGGVQKEAYFLNKPCLIMLEETPWVELLESGNALLVGNDYMKLRNGAEYFLNGALNSFEEIYGDGRSAEFICQKIIDTL